MLGLLQKCINLPDKAFSFDYVQLCVVFLLAQLRNNERISRLILIKSHLSDFCIAVICPSLD